MSERQTAVRVLIADDDAILRAVAVATLEEAGFEVEAVASGEAALAACAQSMPDMALLDVEMPAGNGYEVCAAIRALPGGAHVPIVMVTGLDDSRSIDGAYHAGATDFVVKPINWALLVHRLRYVLRGARTRDALWLSEQKNSALLRAIPDGIYLVDATGSIAHCFSANAAFAAGAARLDEVLPVSAHARAKECLRGALDGSAAACEFSLDAAGSPVRHFECRFLPNGAEHALAIVRDITARKEAEARIRRLAYFDVLTELPNREWLGEFLADTLTDARHDSRTAALLYVDLDQFKRINDTLGHETGDALLRLAAERLTRALARSGSANGSTGVEAHLARVGGDEFIVVLTGNPREQDARQAAECIQAALAAPFVHAGYELVVTPSIGIALFPEHGADAQSLLKNADGAMYEAKASGRNQFRFYTSAVNARALKRLSLEMELRRAFEASKLEVHYQPKYETRDLRLIGGEALLRWHHPERGQIPPSDFVAVAEETGLISDIGRWAMQQVCRDMIEWRRLGLALPSIAVNVSGRDFMRQESVLRLSDAVDQARLSASLFELELTEGVLMQDAEVGRRLLLAMKELGFALAVDDFGTGYCSLNYLKRFPLDTLKIDRSFVEDIGVDADDDAIVRAIIALGHNLDLKIVAEGVSKPAQLEFLRKEGCDAVQGYLFGAAMPMSAFTSLLMAAQSASATSSISTQAPNGSCETPTALRA
jgi:diguanylate cyclase (GGDEF)-like protein